MSRNSFKINKSLVLKPQSSAPANPESGEIYYDNTSNEFKQYNGTFWEPVGSGGSESLNTFAQLYADNDTAWTKSSGTGTSTFSISDVSPLSGTSSYRLNFGGTTDDTFESKTIEVPILFRGNSVQISLAYTYGGPSGSAGFSIYDATNSALLLDSTTNPYSRLNSVTTPQFVVFNFTIPSNCSAIKVRVGATASGTASGTLKFDNIELGLAKNNIIDVGGARSLIRFNGGNLRGSTNTSVHYFTTLSESYGNGLSYVNTSALGTEIHVRRSGIVQVNTLGQRPASASGMLITKNSVSASVTQDTNNLLGGASMTSAGGFTQNVSSGTRVNVGDVIRVTSTTNMTSDAVINSFSVLLIEDNSTNIIQDIETFDSSRNPLVWSSTAITDASPIGTVNSFTFASGTGNVPTLATTRPTQSDEDFRNQGLRLYSRATAASTAAEPAMFKVKIGKDFKGTPYSFLSGFKDVSKTIAGLIFTDEWVSAGDAYIKRGALCFYNPTTGVLTINAGMSNQTTSVSAFFEFEDLTEQNNIYITISASKNPALAGLNAPARQIVKTYSSGTTWWEINSDGWVRQGGVDIGSGGTATIILPIEMLNTSYTPMIGQGSTGYDTEGFAGAHAMNYNSTGTGARTVNTINVSRYSNNPIFWEIKGYASSAALAALGVYVNY